MIQQPPGRLHSRHLDSRHGFSNVAAENRVTFALAVVAPSHQRFSGLVDSATYCNDERASACRTRLAQRCGRNGRSKSRTECQLPFFPRVLGALIAEASLRTSVSEDLWPRDLRRKLSGNERFSGLGTSLFAPTVAGHRQTVKPCAQISQRCPLAKIQLVCRFLVGQLLEPAKTARAVTADGSKRALRHGGMILTGVRRWYNREVCFEWSTDWHGCEARIDCGRAE
jgi:hypothetical protein